MRLRKPFRTAGIAGVVLLVFSLVFGILNQFIILSNNLLLIRAYSLIYSTILFVLGVLFTYGFLVLGRKFNSRLLAAMAWIGIIVAILFFAFTIIANIFINVPGVSAQNAGDDFSGIYGNGGVQDYSQFIDPATGGLSQAGLDIIVFFILAWIVISVILGAYVILFGIGLLKIKKDVELAKVAGILNIISGATFIIFIGFFISIAAMVVEIIMFFKASDRYEKGISDKKKTLEETPKKKGRK